MKSECRAMMIVTVAGLILVTLSHSPELVTAGVLLVFSSLAFVVYKILH